MTYGVYTPDLKGCGLSGQSLKEAKEYCWKGQVVCSEKDVTCGFAIRFAFTNRWEWKIRPLWNTVDTLALYTLHGRGSTTSGQIRLCGRMRRKIPMAEQGNNTILVRNCDVLSEEAANKSWKEYMRSHILPRGGWDFRHVIAWLYSKAEGKKEHNGNV